MRNLTHVQNARKVSHDWKISKYTTDHIQVRDFKDLQSKNFGSDVKAMLRDLTSDKKNYA